jgi:Spy/CpxP family protein refolding chaperone
MMELFTMIVIAANFILASAFAKFASTAANDAATAHQQSSDADIFEGRLLARIRMRNVRSEVWHGRGGSTCA